MQPQKTINRSSLILFDPTDQSILGELTDANWKEEGRETETNYVLSGLAGDGTIDAINLFIEKGLDTVRFEYSDGQNRHSGEAFLLRPSRVKESSGTEVRIESPTKPTPISSL